MITLKETGASFVLDGVTQLEWAVSLNRTETKLRLVAPTKAEAEQRLVDSLAETIKLEGENLSLVAKHQELLDSVNERLASEQERAVVLERENAQMLQALTDLRKDMEERAASETGRKPRFWWSRV